MLRRLLYYAMTVIIVSAQLVNVAKAEFERNFYSTNDILFYDPRCDTGTASANKITLNGKDNIEKILKFFMAPEQGLTLAQASGIIGNLMAESGQNIDPSIIQGGGRADKNYVPVSGTGFGIAQWTFSARQVPLQNFMRPYNDITNLDGQVGFIWAELTSTHSEALRQLKQTSTPLDATIAFHKYYEGSADSAAQVATNRGGNAQKVYNTYADAPAIAGSTATGGTAETTSDQVAGFNPGTGGGITGEESCLPGFGGGDLIKTVQAYAWPTYRGLTTTPTDAYKTATQKAISERRYVGGISYPGIDCGGFTTSLIIDSGFDKTYNYSGLTAKGAGYTVIQEEWLKQNWKQISSTDATDRQPGDVAINTTHTYIFVGPTAFPNRAPIASSSLDERAPMQGNEAVASASFRWYRKPSVAPSTQANIAATAGGSEGNR